MKSLSVSLIFTLIVGASTSGSVLAASKYQPSAKASNTTSELIAEANPGQFVAVEHPTKGQVQIVEEDGARYLEIGQDFQSDSGPDLKVILHRADTVDLKVKEGDYVSLGALQSVNGAQRYLIPEDVDLANYQSVAIWCEEFNATFGYAPLTDSTVSNEQ